MNGVALLPLLLLFAYFSWRQIHNGQMPWPSICPLLLAALQVGVMRNYFAMHPWMASPLLLVGLIFSMALARELEQNTGFTTYYSANNPSSGLRNICILLLCFGYGLSVFFFFRANERNTLALVNLIRHTTERSDVVIVFQELNPETTLLAPRLSEMFDRNVILVKELGDLPVRETGVVVLSAKPLAMSVPPDRFAVLGQTYRSGRLSYLWAISDWFNRSISRRQPGDRLEVADQYFLYRERFAATIK